MDKLATHVKIAMRMLTKRPGLSDAWGTLQAVVAGAIVGIAASIPAGTAVAAFLPEVRGAAWMFAALSGCALVAVGAIAAPIAARGVIAIEPLRALRAD